MEPDHQTGQEHQETQGQARPEAQPQQAPPPPGLSHGVGGWSPDSHPASILDLALAGVLGAGVVISVEQLLPPSSLPPPTPALPHQSVQLLPFPQPFLLVDRPHLPEAWRRLQVHHGCGPACRERRQGKVTSVKSDWTSAAGLQGLELSWAASNTGWLAGPSLSLSLARIYRFLPL